jgi:hypothetical protein
MREITEPTSEAICIAMAKRPEDRYPTYDDLIMALTAARSQLLVRTFREQEREAHPKSWWRR